MVSFYFEDIDSFELKEGSIGDWLRSTVEEKGKDLGDLSLIFCSDDFLLEMNREHLDHDYYTDIITFNYCENDLVSGDLFISVERVKDNANSLKIDWAEELMRVCVHGVLHLVGYNDKTKEEEIEMRKQEDLALSRLDI